VQRARIVLLSAERMAVAEVARRVGVSRPAVWRWQRRFAEEGAAGLERDKTRRPETLPLAAATVARVVAMTCAEPPREAAHWTGRAMAGAAGISLSSVLDGSVIGRCMARHRHQEFIRFLNAVEREVPAGKVIHVILDNYGAHKHPKVRAWLARHPRWTFHFTPASGSWPNAVETFFSTLTRRRLRRGVFRSIVELQAAINHYLAEHNKNPSPFTWTKPADNILDKLADIPAPSV
jgi:transposase